MIDYLKVSAKAEACIPFTFLYEAKPPQPRKIYCQKYLTFNVKFMKMWFRLSELLHFRRKRNLSKKFSFIKFSFPLEISLS